jgi:hypothetical protein
MLSGSQVEAGNLVFHKFSMQSFTFAGGPSWYGALQQILNNIPK